MASRKRRVLNFVMDTLSWMLVIGCLGLGTGELALEFGPGLDTNPQSQVPNHQYPIPSNKGRQIAGKGRQLCRNLTMA